jgi:hypothetical protein
VLDHILADGFRKEFVSVLVAIGRSPALPWIVFCEGVPMPKFLTTMIVAAAFCGSFAYGASSGPTQEEMRSLDEQVQEIKTDVLSIAAELNSLEERLLFPSNTQVAVFVSLEDAKSFRLDAVRIHINGELAAHHIYSFKELDALASGGVQRIYTGNLGIGEHQLIVTVIGKLPNGKDYSQTKQFSFRKEVDPRLLGIAFAGPGTGQPIQLNDW